MGKGLAPGLAPGLFPGLAPSLVPDLANRVSILTFFRSELLATTAKSLRSSEDDLNSRGTHGIHFGRQPSGKVNRTHFGGANLMTEGLSPLRKSLSSLLAELLCCLLFYAYCSYQSKASSKA